MEVVIVENHCVNIREKEGISEFCQSTEYYTKNQNLFRCVWCLRLEKIMPQFSRKRVEAPLSPPSVASFVIKPHVQ